MNNRKWVLLGTVCLLLCVGVIILLSFIKIGKPDYLEINNVGIQYGEEFGVQPVRSEQIGLMPNGAYYTIDKDNTLQLWKEEKPITIEDDVYCSVLIQTGIAFLDDGGVYFYDFNNTACICPNAETLCGDGTVIFYYDYLDHAVYACDGAQNRRLFSYDDRVLSMIANANWIVLFSSEDTIAYNRSTCESISLESMDYPLNIDPNASFLWNNSIIEIGNASLGGTVYDLETQQVKDLNLGCDLREHFTTIASVYSDRTIYLSVSSLLNPKLGDEVWESTMKIDCTNMSVTEICPKFYKNLIYDGNNLYGSTITHATKLD